MRKVGKDKYELNYKLPNGKRKQYRVYARSKKEAYEIKLKDRKDDENEINLPAEERKLPDTPFSIVKAAILKDYLNGPRKTYLRYSKTFTRLFLDDDPELTFHKTYYPSVQTPRQLTSIYFEQYQGYYCSDLGRVSGWRAELIIVRSILNSLERKGFLPGGFAKEAARKLKKPKKRKRDYPDLSDTQIRQLLDFVKADSFHNYLILKFIQRVGRRIEETTLIERGDVKWKGVRIRKINIRAETTKKDEAAPLERFDSDLDKLVKAAIRNSKQKKSKYLFCSQWAKKMNQKTFRKYLKRVSKQLLGVSLTPHYFRHRFLTVAGKNREPFSDVSAISGLKDMQTYMEYYDHSTDSGKDQVLALTKI